MAAETRATSERIVEKLLKVKTRDAQWAADRLRWCLTEPAKVHNYGYGPVCVYQSCKHRLCPHCSALKSKKQHKGLLEWMKVSQAAGLKLVSATFTQRRTNANVGKQWRMLGRVWDRFANSGTWLKRHGVVSKSRFVEVGKGGLVHIHAVLACRDWSPEFEAELKRRWCKVAAEIGTGASINYALKFRPVTSKADFDEAGAYVTKVATYNNYSASVLGQIASGLKGVHSSSIGKLPTSIAAVDKGEAEDLARKGEQPTPPDKPNAAGNDDPESMEGRSASIPARSEAHPEAEGRSGRSIRSAVWRLEGFVGGDMTLTLTASHGNLDSAGAESTPWGVYGGCRSP